MSGTIESNIPEELEKRLTEAVNHALDTYRANRSDWDAGRVDGLRQAAEIVNHCLHIETHRDKARRG